MKTFKCTFSFLSASGEWFTVGDEVTCRSLEHLPYGQRRFFKEVPSTTLGMTEAPAASLASPKGERGQSFVRGGGE